MRRRQVISLLGGAVSFPIVGFAQSSDRMRRVGVLMIDSEGAALATSRLEALSAALQVLGWMQGRNVDFIVRYAAGSPQRAPALAADLVRNDVHVIVTAGTELVAASQQASESIPVIMAGIGDPIGAGIVASLARPGGHVTGLSLMHLELAAKRLELAKETLPGLTSIAMIWNPNNASVALRFVETEAAARMIGLTLESVQVREPSDFEKGIQTASRAGSQALITTEDALVLGHRLQVVTIALRHRLPPISGLRQFAEAGGLLSYGPSSIDLWRRAAGYVDKIFRGTKAADLPVEQPTRFELVVNLRTANTLGLALPPQLLGRADEVIE